MHLLIRRCSYYFRPCLLLGVFRTTDLAESARREYLAKVMHGGADPWASEHDPSPSDCSLIVNSNVDLIACDPTIDRVFVVGASFYGQGEIIRSFRAIAGSRAAAEDLEAKVAAENARDDFFSGTEIVSVPLDTLAAKPTGYHGESA